MTSIPCQYDSHLPTFAINETHLHPSKVSPLVVWLIAKGFVVSVAHRNTDVRRSNGSCVINLDEELPGFAVNEMYGGRALSSPVTVAQAVDRQAWG